MRSSVEVQRGSDECAGQEDVRDVLLGDESEGGRDGLMNLFVKGWGLGYSLGHQRRIHDVDGEGAECSQGGEWGIVVKHVVFRHGTHQRGEFALALVRGTVGAHCEVQRSRRNAGK